MNQEDSKSHESYMEMCVRVAKKNPKAPFGALIVDQTSGEILAEGLNSSISNPTLHGEIDALNNFSKLYPKSKFTNTILYTTAEPCPMCMGAIIWAGIPFVVYGTSIPTLVDKEWRQISIRAEEVIQKSSDFYMGNILGGVLRSKTDLLFDKI